MNMKLNLRQSQDGHRNQCLQSPPPIVCVKERCKRQGLIHFLKYFVLILLFTSLSVFSQQVSPNNALTCAAATNDVEGMKRALESGADINSAPSGSGGKSPLMQATFFGQLDAVQFLIEKKADVNHRDAAGSTALIYAAGFHPEIAAALIKAGADVDIKNYDGFTALLKERNPEIKKLLKDAGAKEIKWTPRWAASPSPSASPSSTASPKTANP